MGQYL